MKYENRDKNPFFLPALIAALIPVIILVFWYAAVNIDFTGVYIGSFDGLFLFLIIIAPIAAIILSGVGIVDGIKLQEPVKGCVFCLAMTVFEVLFFLAGVSALLSRPICASPLTTRSPEESASIESVREEIDRALYGNTTTKTTKS